MQPNSATTTTVQCIASKNPIGGYAEILQACGLEYKEVAHYLQAGEITKTQGWLLHLSVVQSQTLDLLQTVIPFLAEEGISFKIPINLATAEDLLTGNLGIAQIGKIVTIYPENDSIALRLAKKLVKLTTSFRGPFIPTDICLTNVVYTRYGSLNPIFKPDENGYNERYIYDAKGQLIKDYCSIPFQFPKGIPWPFSELAPPVLPAPPKLLNRIYRLTDILKPDPRGNVFKGLYVKNLLQVKHCVVKQGISNMGSDKAGRDMRDRLVWQNDLHKELSGCIPMPVIYDLIQEREFTALVMEYINGSSLYDKYSLINPLCKRWSDLRRPESLKLINYAITISHIIDTLHKRGFIHRDIAPVNFLIDRNDKVILIDLELAYSLQHNKPDPPFTLGTEGFMSPEQLANQHPTVQQDIYGLAATLLYLFTGLTPIKFDTRNQTRLFSNIAFFIDSTEIAEIITCSLHKNANLRPGINVISDALIKYQQDLSLHIPGRNQHLSKPNDRRLEGTIQVAVEGLMKPPIVSLNDLWYSKKVTIENLTATVNKQYTKYPGLSEGICGILYLLARIHKVGFNIDSCRTRFTKGWQFIEDNYFNRIPELSPGLYKGAAGFAIALGESIQSGLLEANTSNTQNLQNCLSLKSDDINLFNGVAGQGVAILQCKQFLAGKVSFEFLNGFVNLLVAIQQKKGYWGAGLDSTGSIRNFMPDIRYDDSGIIWFLLQYISLYPNKEAENAVVKAARGIIGNKRFMKYFYNLVASRSSYELGDGGKGIILMFTKAYEVLNENIYKRVAEEALSLYPPCVVNTNFTQESGLAGLGEVYLEAWRVFKNDTWKSRADWIANVFIHTLHMDEDGSGYWKMEENSPPTADFLTGNSGIIHFLARCLYPDKLGYRLLK
jgi:serine/threonine protein kinase